MVVSPIKSGGSKMNLVKWNPITDVFGVRNPMNRLFDDIFFPFNCATNESAISSWHPSVDIYEDGDHMVIKAELPGVEKENIHVDVNGRVLTLTGERVLDREVNEENYYRQERTFGKFERSFTLPTEIDPENIKADFSKGVLKVDILRPEEQKPKKITVH